MPGLCVNVLFKANSVSVPSRDARVPPAGVTHRGFHGCIRGKRNGIGWIPRWQLHRLKVCGIIVIDALMSAKLNDAFAVQVSAQKVDEGKGRDASPDRKYLRGDFRND